MCQHFLRPSRKKENKKGDLLVSANWAEQRGRLEAQDKHPCPRKREGFSWARRPRRLTPSVCLPDVSVADGVLTDCLGSQDTRGPFVDGHIGGFVKRVQFCVVASRSPHELYRFSA